MPTALGIDFSPPLVASLPLGGTQGDESWPRFISVNRAEKYV
jgi:hypothetical protein